MPSVLQAGQADVGCARAALIQSSDRCRHPVPRPFLTMWHPQALEAGKAHCTSHPGRNIYVSEITQPWHTAVLLSGVFPKVNP